MNPPPKFKNHHLKGLQPILRVMHDKGFSAERCLSGTTLDVESLLQDGQTLSLEQEFTIYRNIQKLDKSPELGLELGQVFELQNYGVLGYAILSAATVAEALELVADFGELTFSHFKISIQNIDDLAGFVFAPAYELPADLLQIYSDRDMSASMTAFNSFSMQKQQATRIYLMHDGNGDQAFYDRFFNCKVSFGQPYNALLFDPDLLQGVLPQRDAQAAQYLRKQCEQLLQSFSQQGGFIDKVRTLMLAEPGQFPGIKTLAEKLHLSERSLRRRLQEENSSYQQLLNDIRFELAKQYLDAGLSIEQIAELLEYSETANFSHAFKRWTGLSPVQFRKQNAIN
ncbi:AraC family transcriptional regulator [Pseudoteredinibacter isoporae]|uniref:AraC-like DNA-binding protein n=1 Tax=Pseudoteredinibacter isoporae TaxID=570281 RepID=A0A7X0MWW0_9GAMM|nr:AraC family transcriptional regulator [Pseudoteredinibacter isoporae]MBB6523081.1 AraC-like DNA-binding protein [Pseudoteredinibacter isoporae]NHO88601.1 AraC family transcriptional regulator [Pseudoteredinibacter isoporae]NIB22708.1 AraC family transcriptional regulator [Pseudoteredinibacter isoporae]